MDDIDGDQNDAGLCRHWDVVAILVVAWCWMLYAVATAHPGIRLIRIPSWCWCNMMVMGVKNGINASGKKNYLGTFALLFAVINHVVFLADAPHCHWRAGVWEACQGGRHQGSVVLRLPGVHAVVLKARDPGG